MSENPRAVAGDNLAPDYAQDVTARMRRDYEEVAKTVEALVEEAYALPAEIDDDATKGRFTHLIKRLRDVAARVTAFHSKEKEPFLRGGQAVDQYFFGLLDKCARRDKKAKPGAGDRLLAVLNAYDTRKLAEERARREREAAEAARVAREARERAEREAREAEERRLAAERARKPEIAERKAEAAAAQEAAADAAKVDASVATAHEQDAHIATLAKPADIMRTRGDDGTLATMGTEKYADVIDATKLDKEALWPFITLEAKEKALRAWANNTGHAQTMPGASVGKRPRSVVR